MTQTFSANALNDIFIGKNGSLSVSSGLEAVLYAAASAAKAQLGEMVYAADQGVANFDTIWRNSANVAQFEASVRQAISNVDGVNEISDFEVTVANNVINYSATIQTDYGTGTLNV